MRSVCQSPIAPHKTFTLSQSTNQSNKQPINEPTSNLQTFDQRQETMAIFSIASLVALAVTSIAASDAARVSKRGLPEVIIPAQSDVEAALNDWNTDVGTVNDFLNSVSNLLSDLPTLATHAQNIVDNFATDEPNQLKTLQNWFTGPEQPDTPPAAFECAFNDLATGQVIFADTFNFGARVIDQFNNGIIPGAQAGDAESVQSAVDNVNNFRCCNVLPDLDIMWRDAAQSAGFSEAEVRFTPSRPTACSSIDCSSIEGASGCRTMDNGRFGTPGSF